MFKSAQLIYGTFRSSIVDFLLIEMSKIGAGGSGSDDTVAGNSGAPRERQYQAPGLAGMGVWK
jgi:hypothetical protein